MRLDPCLQPVRRVTLTSKLTDELYDMRLLITNWMNVLSQAIRFDHTIISCHPCFSYPTYQTLYIAECIWYGYSHTNQLKAFYTFRNAKV